MRMGLVPRRLRHLLGGVEREADLEDVYYAPEVHVRLLSLGKLEGWGVRFEDGRMELKDRYVDLFIHRDYRHASWEVQDGQ